MALLNNFTVFSDNFANVMETSKIVELIDVKKQYDLKWKQWSIMNDTIKNKINQIMTIPHVNQLVGFLDRFFHDITNICLSVVLYDDIDVVNKSHHYLKIVYHTFTTLGHYYESEQNILKMIKNKTTQIENENNSVSLLKNRLAVLKQKDHVDDNMINKCKNNINVLNHSIDNLEQEVEEHKNEIQNLQKKSIELMQGQSTILDFSYFMHHHYHPVMDKSNYL